MVIGNDTSCITDQGDEM